MSLEIHLLLRGFGTHWVWRHIRYYSNYRFDPPSTRKLIPAAIGFPIIILLLIPVRMYICPLVCSAEELFELDAPVASPFTMESVGASVVGVRASTETSPEETSGETDGQESESGEEDDWRRAMERGDAMKLKRRTSSMVGARTRRESKTLDTRGGVMTGESSRAPI